MVEEQVNKMVNDIQEVIIANCGLVCSKCGMYIKGKCKGCFGGKPMYKNCPIKKCNEDNSYSTCADCKEFAELKKCKKLHNIISRFFGFIFRTNRIVNLNRIREVGLEIFKAENK